MSNWTRFLAATNAATLLILGFMLWRLEGQNFYQQVPAAQPKASASHALSVIEESSPVTFSPEIKPIDTHAPVTKTPLSQKLTSPSLDTRETRKLKTILGELRLDSQYAKLFAELHLSPGRIQALRALIVESQSVTLDLRDAIREKGVALTEQQTAEIKNTLVGETEKKIEGLLGPDNYEKYKWYSNSYAERHETSMVADRIAYESAPLSELQAKESVDLLIQAKKIYNEKIQAAGTKFDPIESLNVKKSALLSVQGLSESQQASISYFYDKTIEFERLRSLVGEQHRNQ